MLSTREMFERRRQRNRTASRKIANGQPRLSVHRTSKHIYAQIIDDKAKGPLLALHLHWMSISKKRARQAQIFLLQLLSASWSASAPEKRVENSRL
jgi:ribosomal protein L18